MYSIAAYILPHITLGDEELGAEIVFINNLVVDDSQGANASEYKVLSNLICQSLDGD